MLLSNLPPWELVYHLFREWARENVGAALNNLLRPEARALEGKRPQPTAVILDSQSVNSDPHGGQVRSDAAKRIKGQAAFVGGHAGLVLGTTVSPSNVPEREAALGLVARRAGLFQAAAQPVGGRRL